MHGAEDLQTLLSVYATISVISTEPFLAQQFTNQSDITGKCWEQGLKFIDSLG